MSLSPDDPEFPEESGPGILSLRRDYVMFKLQERIKKGRGVLGESKDTPGFPVSGSRLTSP